MKNPSPRPKFTTRSLVLINESVLANALLVLKNTPIDPMRPLLVTIGEQPKVRTPDQNSAYHAGIVRPMADQAWVRGLKYSEVIWHEQFKREYLPDENLLSPEELAKRVKNPATYVKWATDMRVELICVGSTTDLTKFGMREYCVQCTAFGSSLGVHFSTKAK